MSVTTTADEKRGEAKDHVKKAYECLLTVLDIDTWGSSNYTDTYIDDMHEVALSLLKLHRKI